jgi:hypothetical protein
MVRVSGSGVPSARIPHLLSDTYRQLVSMTDNVVPLNGDGIVELSERGIHSGA